ncbi:hypothetical protein TNCV_2023911 [Trichonephila clavipes]|nr:hypothetical protein TNCV_2023911 [Trichonephila clavipes]
MGYVFPLICILVTPSTQFSDVNHQHNYRHSSWRSVSSSAGINLTRSITRLDQTRSDRRVPAPLQRNWVQMGTQLGTTAPRIVSSAQLRY